MGGIYECGYQEVGVVRMYAVSGGVVRRYVQYIEFLVILNILNPLVRISSFLQQHPYFFPLQQHPYFFVH